MCQIFCPLYIDVVCIVNVSVWEPKVVVALAGPRYFQLGPAGPPPNTPPLRVTPHIHMLDISKQQPFTQPPTLNTLPCQSPNFSRIKVSSIKLTPFHSTPYICPFPRESCTNPILDLSPFCLTLFSIPCFCLDLYIFRPLLA